MVGNVAHRIESSEGSTILPKSLAYTPMLWMAEVLTGIGVEKVLPPSSERVMNISAEVVNAFAVHVTYNTPPGPTQGIEHCPELLPEKGVWFDHVCPPSVEKLSTFEVVLGAKFVHVTYKRLAYLLFGLASQAINILS